MHRKVGGTVLDLMNDEMGVLDEGWQFGLPCRVQV
jgi:hypothetical protein